MAGFKVGDKVRVIWGKYQGQEGVISAQGEGTRGALFEVGKSWYFPSDFELITDAEGQTAHGDSELASLRQQVATLTQERDALRRVLQPFASQWRGYIDSDPDYRRGAGEFPFVDYLLADVDENALAMRYQQAYDMNWETPDTVGITAVMQSREPQTDEQAGVDPLTAGQ